MRRNPGEIRCIGLRQRDAAVGIVGCYGPGDGYGFSGRGRRGRTQPRAIIERRIAFEVEARAKQKAPVDTGALRASIYTRTGRLDAPPLIVTDAERVALPAPEDGVAHVGPSVEHGAYRELGTSRNAPQPYLGPAVAEVRANLQRYRDDFRRLAEGR